MGGFGAESTAEQVTEGLDLTGKTYLVTGCNSGLGRETTRVLSKRGARVIALARTEKKASDALSALGAEGVPVACELSDLDSVRGAVHAVAEVGALDGIIANAGIMALPTLTQVKGLEAQFATNHLGHFVLITGIADALTPTGRVVMLSSGAHRMAKRGLELDNLSGETDYDPWRMYGRSKLANILFARSLAKQFAGSGRTANAVHPGVIETNLGRHVPDRAAMYERLKHIAKTVEQGAATQCYVAVHPSVGKLSGAYFSDCAQASTLPAAKDDALADALWERSLELAGV